MPRPRTVFHRLAPKRPSRVEHQLCPECGCCTRPPGGSADHWYDARVDEWTCWCDMGPSGFAELAGIVNGVDEDDFDDDGFFIDDEEILG